MGARVQGGEEKCISCNITKKNETLVGGKDVLLLQKTAQNTEQRRIKLGFVALFQGSSCHLCSPLFLSFPIS